MSAKRDGFMIGAAAALALLASVPAAAQDQASPTEHAFELLGLGGEVLEPTTDPALVAEGLPILEAQAAAGDAVAQNALGMAYANGLFGLEINVDKAIALYESAMNSELVGTIAKLNWGNAQFALGNFEPAVERLQEVHASDSEVAPAAAAMLAQAYAFGSGVPEDLLRAGALYEEAVAFSPVDSQSHYMLGRGYESGFFEGGRQPERALTHYLAAAELGDPRAAWKVGMAHLQAVPGFEGGSAEAYDWVRRSAEGGWIDGMISTAVMLATGDGVERNPAEAASWYEQAAARGSAHAMRGLGAMHWLGEIEGSDPDLGLALIELAVEGGDEMARSALDDIENVRRRVDRDEVDRLKAEWRQRIEAAP